MNKLALVLFFLTLNAFSQTAQKPQVCPPMHGYVSIKQSGDIEFYIWNGLFGFNITAYEFAETKGEVKGHSYFVKFDQNFDTPLYDALDCSVRGVLKVKDVNPRNVVIPNAQ